MEIIINQKGSGNLDNSCDKYKIDYIIDNMSADAVKSLCKKLAFAIIENDSDCGMMKIILESLKVKCEE